jgi:uncharacterized membrane protein YqaE (UPF0057 family)
MSVTPCGKSELVIIRFANQSAVFKTDICCARNNNNNQNDNQTDNQNDIDNEFIGNTKITRWIHQKVKEKWGLDPNAYYLDIPRNNYRIIEIQPRIKGGNPIKAIFKVILGGIMSIFKPIVKPLAGIANAFLMLVKGVLYIIMLLQWFLKFCAWFFTEVLPSIPADIFGMVRFISFILIDSIVGTIGYYFKKIFNSAGSTVVGAALSGWDNNPDESPGKPIPAKNQNNKASKFGDTETPSESSTTVEECTGRKCYKTEAGTVPWTVILATVLFPPSGVFMELGLHGWIQILVCLLLTFMFYFPGLIYALIILYC